MLHAPVTGFNLLPVSFSTLGGWHPDAHKALCFIATTMAAVVKSHLTSRWLNVVDNKRFCRNKPVERGRDTTDLNPVSAQKGFLTFASIYFSILEGAVLLASDQPLLYYLRCEL